MKQLPFIGIALLILTACLPPQAGPVTPVPTLIPATQTAGAPEAPTQTEAIPTPTTAPTEMLASALPDPTGLQLNQLIMGLDIPTDLTHAGDGSGRLFIVEKPGLVKILLADGSLASQPFLDITGRVGSDAYEQGLLGLAFHPDYATNGHFYVYYTNLAGNTVVSRFTVSPDPNLANPASEVILLTQEQPYRNHNGGGLAFGPDGYLYISLGDGGSAGDPLQAGQSLNTLLGKILRIDVNTEGGYLIPPDNPFASSGGLPEIWAYGLRNAWRIAFDPANGDLYIADVGQNQWEEVNVVLAGTPGGLNFGWDLMEGNHPFEGAYSENLTLPVVEYSHDQGCSITGGHVYRGESMPQMQGVYLFGDFCSGNVWGLLKSGDGWVSSILFRSGIQISTFGQDEAGEIYLGGYNGTLYRLEAAP